ncbi:hypothetical protein SHL12_000499 [Salmonella enterica]|nr:hypothetical protein [Salmonella enterica]
MDSFISNLIIFLFIAFLITFFIFTQRIKAKAIDKIDNSLTLYSIIFNKGVQDHVTSPQNIISHLKIDRFYPLVTYLPAIPLFFLVLYCQEGLSLAILTISIIALLSFAALSLTMSLDIYENAIVHNTLLRKSVFLFSQLDSIDEKIDYDGVPNTKEEALMYPRYYAIVKNGRVIFCIPKTLSNYSSFKKNFNESSIFIKEIIGNEY